MFRLDRRQAATPTLQSGSGGAGAKLTSAPSSNSSFGAALAAVEPRWTPFQDRTGNRWGLFCSLSLSMPHNIKSKYETLIMS